MMFSEESSLLASLFGLILARYNMMRERQRIAGLMNLSDRILTDVGLTRFDLEIALETVKTGQSCSNRLDTPRNFTAANSNLSELGHANAA